MVSSVMFCLCDNENVAFISQGSYLDDCLVHFTYGPCALAQEAQVPTHVQLTVCFVYHLYPYVKCSIVHVWLVSGWDEFIIL